jgi:hypothetical protein
MSARRYFSRNSALFERRATKERVLHLREYVDASSRIKVCTIFFERNIIMSDLSCSFVNRWRLSSQIIFNYAQKGECFLAGFEALVREIYVRAPLCGRETSL